MSKGTQRTRDRRRAETSGPQPAKGASLDLASVPGGSQSGSQLSDKSDTKAEASPQGTLPALSVPGGTQTDSELTDKHREDANVEVSPEGALQ
jgi:hypothetical protein